MKPKAYVFTGPTLARTDLVPPEGVAFLPPAAQGDVYRAAREKPVAIGIVDGYFEGQASIWHKEILWAMTEGIHVFGSASMGALRAAELHVFGMQGVGAVFEAYRDGRLDDDDEVAVLHAPDDAGFLPLSEPMVNIRATLEEARRQNVIETAISGQLERLAKATFYQERRWPDLLAAAEAASLDPSALRALKAWLPDHRADLKRADALLMIEAISACLDRAVSPPPPGFHFEWTEMWDDVVKHADSTPLQTPDSNEDKCAASVLEEARLQAGPSDPLYRLALLRYLSRADHVPMRSAEQSSAAAKTAFRQREGLFRRADLDSWLARHHLDDAGFEQAMADETAIEAMLVAEGSRIGYHILDELRLDGRYLHLAERAAAKRHYLDTIGKMDPSPAEFPISLPQLRAWYFEQQRQEAIPDDINHYARRLGFGDHQHFDQALRREYLFVSGKQ